jgi:hypothetical protein
MVRNPPLFYHMASHALGKRVVVLVHVDYRSIATDELAGRALRAFKRWVRGIEIVLAGRNFGGPVKYVGAPEVVRALEGRQLGEFQWRRKAVD